MRLTIYITSILSSGGRWTVHGFFNFPGKHEFEDTVSASGPISAMRTSAAKVAKRLKVPLSQVTVADRTLFEPRDFELG